MAIRADSYLRVYLPYQEANSYPSEDDVAIELAREQELAHEEALSSLVQHRGWGCVICIDAEKNAFLPCGHGECLDCLTSMARKICTTCRQRFTQANIRQIVGNDEFECGICNEPAYLSGPEDKGPPVLSTLCGRITVAHSSGQNLGVQVGHLFHERCYREREVQHECPSCSPEQKEAARAIRQPDLGLSRQDRADPEPVFLPNFQFRDIPPIADPNVLEDLSPIIMVAGYALFLIAVVFDSEMVAIAGFEAMFIGATGACLSLELYGLALATASFAALVIAALANVYWLVTPLLYTAAAGFTFEVMHLVPIICEEIVEELWR